MGKPLLLHKAKQTFTHSVTLKLVIVGCLVGILLLPSSMIQSLIHERETRKSDVIEDIHTKWANAQTITGPILSLPYRTPDNTTHVLHVLPETLAITTNLQSQVRYRSIYEAVLYTADIHLQGTFRLPDTDELFASNAAVVWDDALISLGLSDVRGITDSIQATWNDRAISMAAGIPPLHVLPSGVVSEVSLPNGKARIPFTFTVKVKGNSSLNIMPVGAMNTVTMNSNWSSPSFNGASLPNERTISNDGFTATWMVLEVNRTYPQLWHDREYEIAQSAFGVTLVMPVNIYQMSMRAVKYAFIFIILTFTIFFLAEMLNEQRIHPIQYLLIGFAILVFYTLLLSMSEHLPFSTAYLVASLAVTLLITIYAKMIIPGVAFMLTVVGLLSCLYGYLYILLQLEDFALLSGSVGLFLLIGVLMFVTRNIDWYAIRFSDDRSGHDEDVVEVDNQTILSSNQP